MSRRLPRAVESDYPSIAPMFVGTECIVDASGCDPGPLRDLVGLQGMLDRVVRELDLHPVGAPLWHAFEGAGGVTGMYLLSESHLTAHTYPEWGVATFNLYCCRPRAAWPWEQELRAALGAAAVSVRTVSRGA